MTDQAVEALAAALLRHTLPRITSMTAADPASGVVKAGGTVWRCSCGDWELRTLPPTDLVRRPLESHAAHVASALAAAGYVIVPAAPSEGLREAERLLRRSTGTLRRQISRDTTSMRWRDGATAAADYMEKAIARAFLAAHAEAGEP